MGATPSREASGSIRTLRYGNHEIGLIPLTRQFFNRDNPELCQQFIRVRNDPNVRYCHMRAAGYGMDELPPAEYTQADLDALVDTVEESLFDTNEDFLSAGEGNITSFTISEMHRILQKEGIIDPFDPKLDQPDDSVAPPSSADAEANTTTTTTTAARAAVPPPPELRLTNAAGEETPLPAETPAQSVERTFRSLKRELQAFYRAAERDDPADYEARTAAFQDLFQTVAYRRFKRAIRPLPCAVVFIYVNSREEHDCFAFRGHRINVIGCFGLRSYEDESDDTIPLLQIRKGIVKAAGDRTLERVLALAAKTFADSFTEIVLRELQRKPASVLLRHVGEEGRRLLREVPDPSSSASSSAAAGLLVGGMKKEPTYDPVSVANALFFERMSKYPMLVVGLFNNYPTLKFVYDFSALAISVDDGGAACPEAIRLCTFQREKDERGLAFIYPGRLVAYTWLWTALQTSQVTVRDAWVQYTLNDFAQSRERHVQQWLATSPAAKTMLGNTTTTKLFLQHLDNLHSEIVRARTTSIEDTTSWAPAQEYSYDTKLYRIFISPICGPLLTTVKEQKGSEAALAAAAKAKKSTPRTRSPLKSLRGTPTTTTAAAAAAAGRSSHASSAATSIRADRDGANSQLSNTPSQSALDAMASRGGNVAVVLGTNVTAVPPYGAAATSTSAHPASSTSSSGTTPPAAKAVTHRPGPPPPPSYSTLTRPSAYPAAAMPAYPSPQALQHMYLQAISKTGATPANAGAATTAAAAMGGGIAVPVTASGAPWVVPQFVSQPPALSGAATSNAAMQPAPPPPPPQPPQLSTAVSTPPTQHHEMASSGTAATYILQISGDGKQTILPIALAPTGVQTSYNVQSLSNTSFPATNAMAATFTPPSSFPGMHLSPAAQQQQQQQQHLFPLANNAVAGAVYYNPATGYAPASYITPLQAPQPMFSTAVPTMAVSPAASYTFVPPPSTSSASISVTTPPPMHRMSHSVDAYGRVAAVQPPAPPYSHPHSSRNDVYGGVQSTPPTNTTSLLNAAKAPTPPQQQHAPPPQQQQQHRDVHTTEETELFANALRLLD